MRFFFKPKKRLSKSLILTNEEQKLLASLNIVEALGTAIKNKTQNQLEGLYETQIGDVYESAPNLRGIKSLVDREVSVPTML
jgi:ABC-type branched-subunit amino acid transport system ATPase component